MDDRLVNEVADRIVMLLIDRNKIGKSNAWKQADAAVAAGTNTRMLQHATFRLNERGVAALANCGHPPGIYIAGSDAEIEEYIRNLRSRLIGDARRIGFLRRILRQRREALTIEPDGQRRMFE